MNQSSILALALFLPSVLCFACGGDDDIPPEPDMTCSSTDGRTACRSEFCAANSWCDTILCSTGCKTSANCAAGEYCDTRGSTGVDEAGVCRPCSAMRVDAGPGPDVPAVDAGPRCSDVSGNYALSVRSGNPPVCSMLEVPSGGVSVSQSGTTATWTYADGDSIETLWSCELDSARCLCTGSLSFEGVTGTIEWMPEAEEISASAMGLICNFNARAQ